jgi:antibiotic biosynthesis monooxygenase (ABM) superfamily enzyme
MGERWDGRVRGWFDDPGEVVVADAEPPAPPRWTQTVSIFIVFSPLSLVLRFFAAPVLGGAPLRLRRRPIRSR